MLQEMLNTIEPNKLNRFARHQARFLANVRSRVQAMKDSGDQEALALLVASIAEILDAAMGTKECQ